MEKAAPKRKELDADQAEEARNEKAMKEWRAAVQIVRAVLHVPRRAMHLGASRSLRGDHLRPGHRANDTLHEHDMQSHPAEAKKGGGCSKGSPGQGQ